MADFPDLQTTQYFDPSDKNYYDIDIKGLLPETVYGFKFQWEFEDPALNLKYKDFWSNTFILETIPLPKAESTNIVAAWIGTNLEISWTCPTYSTGFQIELTGNVLGVSKTVPFGHKKDLTTTSQKIVISKELIMLNFGNVFQTSLTGFLRTDYINSASNGVSFTIPAFTDGLTSSDIPDSAWSLTATDNGFIVAWTLTDAQIASGLYNYGEVWWSDTQSGTFTKRAIDKSPIAIQGVLSTKYIKIRYYTLSATNSNFSSVKSVSPYSPITVDVTGPPDVSTVTTTGGLDSTGTIGFNGYADISWSTVTTGGIRGYRIRYRPVTTPVSNYSYADSPGAGTSYRLSGLGASLTYEIAVATYDEFNNTSTSYVSGANVVVGGTPYIASTVDVTGYFSSKANASDASSTAFKFGYGVDTGKRGLVFNTNNYWYIDSSQGASLKIGGADNYVQWNGSSLAVIGDIQAKKGTFSGNINLASGASIYSGTITGNTSTASSDTGGTLSGDGYILNSTGLIVRKTVAGIQRAVQLSTTDGSITANYGTIAGWTIDSNSINKGNQVGFYAPDSPVSTDVVIWSGGTRASNAFNITYGGKLTAVDVNLSGTIKAIDGFIGSKNLDGTLNKGWSISGAQIRSSGASVGTTTLILDGETGTISGGTVVANSFKTADVVSPGHAGIKINTDGIYAYSTTNVTGPITNISSATGVLYAEGAEIRGTIKAETGYIGGSGGTASGFSIDGTYIKSIHKNGAVPSLQLDGSTGTISTTGNPGTWTNNTMSVLGGKLSADKVIYLESPSVEINGTNFTVSTGGTTEIFGTIKMSGNTTFYNSATFSNTARSNASEVSLTGAYFRNIYTNTSDPVSAGNIGDVWITYA